MFQRMLEDVERKDSWLTKTMKHVSLVLVSIAVIAVLAHW